MVDLILAIHRALRGARIGHAFGGALALGFVAEPRGTRDIDLNVFVGPDEMDGVHRALRDVGYENRTEADAPPIAGLRFEHRNEPFPLDVFPSLDALYDVISERVVTHPFGAGLTKLPFLSAEDLCVFKLSFGRPQDWIDLASIASARADLDFDYIEEMLVGLRGTTMYPRVARLRGLAR